MTIEDLMKRLKEDEAVNSKLPEVIRLRYEALKDGRASAMTIKYLEGCLVTLRSIGKITQKESTAIWKEIWMLWEGKRWKDESI